MSLLHQVRLNYAIRSDLVAYCDPHDLVAIVNHTWDVIVYRINGEVAFTIRRPSPTEPEVSALGWKQDGSILAVGSSDGIYRLYSGESGKILSETSTRRKAREQVFHLDLPLSSPGEADDHPSGSKVVLIAWTKHQRSQLNPANSELSGESRPAVSTEPWLDGIEDAPEQRGAANEEIRSGNSQTLSALAWKLATTDATEVMPKLSAVPSHSLRGEPILQILSSQQSTDEVFEVNNYIPPDVDVLCVCCSDGTALVSVDDTVEIGTCNIGSTTPELHCAQFHSGVHTVVSRSVDEPNALQLSTVNLPLNNLGSTLMHVVATFSKRIQSLLDYIKCTVRCMQEDFTVGLQLPGRLISSINETLSEKQQGDLALNLCHLAMTHDFTPTMLEWLVESVKETNHRRWGFAINNMYNHIQDHLVMHLVPSLDRLSIATTLLRGHASFHEGTGRFDVAPKLFTKVLDGIDSLRLVAQKVQLLIMTEHAQFQAFSRWLRLVIELGVAGPGSKGFSETEEREMKNVDPHLARQYIMETMMGSSLAVHLEQRPEMDGMCSRQEFYTKPTIKGMSYENTAEVLKRLDALKAGQRLEWREVEDPRAQLNIPAITAYLAGNIKLVLNAITAWQGKILPAPGRQSVPVARDTRLYDANMAMGKGDLINLLTMPPGPPHRLDILRIGRPNSDSIDVGSDLEVLDAKLYEEQAFVLSRSFAGLFHLGYISSISEMNGELSLWHTFTTEAGGFSPEKLLVGGRKGKMVCVVLSSRGWDVFDLERKHPEAQPMHTDDWMDEDRR